MRCTGCILTILGLLTFNFMPVGAPNSARAQESSSCQAIVNQAFEALVDHCVGLGVNQICYAYGDVQVEFSENGDESSDDVPFTEPGDRVDITSLRSVRTAPLDVTAGDYGLAVMNLWADLPASYAHNPVTVVISGGVIVTNGVPESITAVPASDPISIVLAQSPAALYDYPGVTDPFALVSESETVADSLIVDGRSADGLWLRVDRTSTDDSGAIRATGWIAQSDVVTNDQFAALPVLDIALSPFQIMEVTLENPDQAALCPEAQPGLSITGPDDVPATLWINRVPFTVGEPFIVLE